MLHKIIVTLIFALGCTLAAAQSTPATLRLRGTLEKVEAGSVTVKERRGEVLTLVLPENVSLSEVVPIRMEDIKPGSYIGVGAMPLPDGTQEALEVHVFPEASRGTGEGHRPWDMQPNSTMTNATVAELGAAPQGRRMLLKYKDGEKVVIVPQKTPVVTYKPGDKSLIVPGAKVIVFVAQRDGKPTAVRMLIGRNGFTPPM